MKPVYNVRLAYILLNFHPICYEMKTSQNIPFSIKFRTVFFAMIDMRNLEEAGLVHFLILVLLQSSSLSEDETSKILREKIPPYKFPPNPPCPNQKILEGGNKQAISQHLHAQRLLPHQYPPTPILFDIT